ncbi:helix-turn-helix domain-containing protein [Rhizobium leguminosarum]|uniref:helix-turn-helix domain-containing protein n=1 Tax=Rhizobium leguminosarum TaxID=384 RepID=UPI0004784FCB|nr:helix-turn-helix transcriptional regulator [Rhizobium leguminosarum]
MKLKPEDIESLANRIEAKRLASGYSYSDIARISAVNQGQVSRICRGQFKTASGNVMQICMMLGVDAKLDEPADFVRIQEAVLNLWDGTSVDAERITRLLGVVNEVRRTT